MNNSFSSNSFSIKLKIRAGDSQADAQEARCSVRTKAGVERMWRGLATRWSAANVTIRTEGRLCGWSLLEGARHRSMKDCDAAGDGGSFQCSVD